MAAAFIRRGRGPSVLCLHGIGSGSAAFRPQLTGLSDELDMLAWDAPGYGASADPESAPGLDGYVDAAAELIRAEVRDSVHVLGVSWGGVIALRLASRHPNLVRSLVVAGASLGSGVSGSGSAQMRQRAVELEEVGAAAFAAARGPRLVSPSASTDLVETVVATMSNSVRMPGYAYAAEAMAEADLTSDVHRVSMPCLVLAGSDDDVTGPPRAREIHQRIPGAAMVTIPGAGHLVNQEQPTAFNTWLLGFIRIAEQLTTTRKETQ